MNTLKRRDHRKISAIIWVAKNVVIKETEKQCTLQFEGAAVSFVRLIGIKIAGCVVPWHDMCSTTQHDTCIIYTGVVWLVLPAAMMLNYHLALIAGWNALR